MADLLSDAKVTKVMHAASEDLQVFDVLCGTQPAPLFDTQVAAAFAGLGASMSYHALVQAVCEVTLEKSQTRSDWSQRPLTPAQLHYAADDVRYLPEVFERLHEKLAARGFVSWFEEEMQTRMDGGALYPEPEACVLRVKGAARLPGPAQHRLRALAAWRERRARERDVPRNRLAKDADLMALSTRPCKSINELKAVTDLHPAALRRHGDALLNEAREAFVQFKDNNTKLEPIVPVRDTRRVTDKIKRLRTHVEARAEALDVPATLLGTTRDIEDTVIAAAEPQATPGPLAHGWRAEALDLEGKDIATL